MIISIFKINYNMKDIIILCVDFTILKDFIIPNHIKL